MANIGVVFDPLAAPGQKFPSQAVRDEIGELAPVFIEAGSVTESKYGDASIPTRAYHPGSINSVAIAVGGIEMENYADGSVGTDALEDGGVTLDKAGIGVVTAIDKDGNPVQMSRMYLSAADYAQILVPDPNTEYIIT